MTVNPITKAFFQTLSTRYPVDGASMSNSEWMIRNTSDPKRPGRPFSFDGYEFQRAIADDMSRQLAVIKPSQVGLTEIQVRKALTFAARNRGTSTIFTLPSEKMFKRVSKTRIKPLVQRERVFKTNGYEERSVQAVDLIEINGSWVYVTGMTEGDATSIPADMLAHDEVDLSDQTMIGLYQSRLQNSPWKITQKFSTPTLPNYGVDAVYQASDQKEYLCRCSACNHWQAPLYEIKFVCIPGYRGEGDLRKLTEDEMQGINLQDAYVQCERCSSPLEWWDPQYREWVPKHPGRRISGYRIRPFSSAALTPAYIIEQLFEMQRLEQIKGWYNTVLGETYADGSNQITAAQVRACMKGGERREIGSLVPIAVGIDVGQVCNLVWGPITPAGAQATNFELVPVDKLYERIKELDLSQRILCGGMDRLPYTPDANAIRDLTNGRIVPIQYGGSRLVDIKKDALQELDYATCNRTGIIDLLAGRVRRGAIEMSGYLDMGDVIIQHLGNMVRVDETPETEATWNKISNADHWFHALVYLNISTRVRDVIDFSTVTETRTEIYIGPVDDGRRYREPALIGRGRTNYFGE